jgi:hypothetical protein
VEESDVEDEFERGRTKVMRVKLLGEPGSRLQPPPPIDPWFSQSDGLRRPRMPSMHDPYSSQPCHKKKGSNAKTGARKLGLSNLLTRKAP